MDVILVDENDNPIGTMEKMEAHQKGVLHRAFSVFIFNSKGEMLIHKRADNKYHSPALWSNACCSHPKPGQQTLTAATIRLQEEMGFTTSLEKAFDFSYTAQFSNGLTENEFDHVYIGTYDGDIRPDKNEVSDYCFKSISEIINSFNTHAKNFTVWFSIAFPKMQVYLNGNASCFFITDKTQH